MEQILLFFSTLLFCCTVSILIIPFILERIFIHTPLLVRHFKKGEVSQKSLVINLIPAFVWILFLIVFYLLLKNYTIDLFTAVTSSLAAIISWILMILDLIYQLINKDSLKKTFYEQTYPIYKIK